MMDQTFLIQDVLESLQELERQLAEYHQQLSQQKGESLSFQQLTSLQALQQAYEAKQQFLNKITGKSDIQLVLVEQLKRLAALRKEMLDHHAVSHVWNLPLKEGRIYAALWQKSDLVLEMIDAQIAE